jgi:hypothetical protein
MRREHDRDQRTQVHTVTSAGEAASIESKQRLRAYAIKMGLRVVLFVGGAIVAVTWNEWVGLGMLAVSAVLPWVAVMGANLIRPPEQVKGVDYDPTAGRRGLTDHDSAEDDGAADAPGTGITIEGEIDDADPDADGDTPGEGKPS